MSDENKEEKLVFTDYDTLREAIENLETEKIFDLARTENMVFLTRLEIEDRKFLSIAVGRAQHHNHYLILYEISGDKLIEIDSLRRSKGYMDSKKKASEYTILCLAFKCLEDWGGGL